MTLDDTITRKDFENYKALQERKLELKDCELKQYYSLTTMGIFGISSMGGTFVSCNNLYDANYGWGIYWGVSALLALVGFCGSMNKYIDSGDRMRTLEQEIIKMRETVSPRT